MGGIYEFDIEFPPSYPTVPPLVTFKTTAGGRVRFNPNLYACGKVCLSLLGTWLGEKWIPNTSTLLQVNVNLKLSISDAINPIVPYVGSGFHSKPRPCC